ncbi:MAG: DUF2335 domain-containing protein [Candidatus Sabulitectum sp.]|nr:DUF2335 domain-containing protein [Candidatus Sabulitectum sp.]
MADSQKPKKDSSEKSLAKRQADSIKSDEIILEEILSEPERRERAIAVIERQMLHIGPLPDPDTLERYNNIIPNGAERIMCMAEEQSSHRRSIESTVIDSREDQNKRGQTFAFILALFFGLVGLTLALQGYTKAAIAAFGLPITTIVVAFIRGRGKQH